MSVNGEADEMATEQASDNVPPPSANRSSLLSRVVGMFRKPTLDAAPQAKLSFLQTRPKIMKSFVTLGKSLLGQAVEIDDRQNIFQDGVKVMSQFGSDSTISKEINAAAIGHLHSKHRLRPSKFLGSSMQPAPGQQAYAIRIEGQGIPGPLPKTEQVFEALLQADRKISHANGISGLAFALATLVSMCLVRTNPDNSDFNDTSPYLDLSPLYGSKEEETNRVRAKDGRGLLSPDCFFEDRILLMPHSVAALLILWNRNHNYIARRLLINNEKSIWLDPNAYPQSPNGMMDPQLLVQDDEIFNLARRINCFQFKNSVCQDFLKGLLGVPLAGQAVSLDLSVPLKQSEVGQEHDSSVEYSLLYNFSSLMSEEDVRRAEDALKSAFIDAPPNEIALDDFLETSVTIKDELNPNPRKRDCAGLKRGFDMQFKDDDLARVLQDTTESPAGEHCSNGIPPCLRVAQVAVMEQARKWQVCSLNEFRKYLGLKPFKDFKDWNPNPEVVKAAEGLYKSIDRLELYPGLQAEEKVPGLGFSLGYTMNFALLVDIVTLIRSDPLFTKDCTDAELTKWGFKECQLEPNNGASGAMLPKLLQRNLPRHYPYNNVYSLFPLVTPNKALELLPGDGGLYEFERPKVHAIKALVTKSAISHVFNNPASFPTIYNQDLRLLTNGYGHFSGFDNEKLHDKDLMLTMYALIPDKGALSRYARYYRKTTAELIKTRAKREGAIRTVNVVQDVINAVCVRWVCEHLCDMPLPGLLDRVNQMNEKAGAEETATFEEFAALYAFVFRNHDPENGWVVREAALKASERLSQHIAKKLPEPYDRDETWVEKVLAQINWAKDYATRLSIEFTIGKRLPPRSSQTFLDRLVKSSNSFELGHLAEEVPHLNDFLTQPGNIKKEELEEQLEKDRIVANVLGLVIVASVNYAQALAQAVDFYLEEKYSKEKGKIVELCTKEPTPRNNALLMGYIKEAMRLGQPLRLFREAKEDTVIQQGGNSPSVSIQAGDRIFADFGKAHTAADIQDALAVDPTRVTPSLLGLGLHKCPAMGFNEQTMPEIFRAIFSLKNIRRTDAKKGRLMRFDLHPQPIDTDPKIFMEPDGAISYFPKTLVVEFDAEGETKDAQEEPKRVKAWSKIRPGLKNMRVRQTMDRFMKVFVALFLLWILSSLLRSVWSLRPSFLSGKRRRPRAPMNTVVPEAPIVACPQPITVFQPWDTFHFVPGPDGHPVPIEYELDHPRPHRLSVMDLDARDIRMTLFVDDVLRGITRDFELDKNVTCGEDLRSCLNQGFSAGMIVIDPGKHKVRVEWAGKEFVPDTQDSEMDWGEEKFRRISWQREYCS